MAISPEQTYPARATPADANYPEGSIKNETVSGVSDDGTPLDQLWGNDFEGIKQALMRAAALTPTGAGNVPDTAIFSQMLQSIVEIASGRAYGYDDVGAVDAYILDTKTNQQGVQSYFDGLLCEFLPAFDNTGASTVNVNGLGLKNIKTVLGLDPAAAILKTTELIQIKYRSALGWFEIVEFGGGGQLLGNLETKAISYNAQTVGEDITIAADQNAFSVGDIEILDTFTVTIADGGVWLIG